ncbi:MAG: glycosyltransferase family 4 protein [Euryarchaeota archaeon]|nr:glycosyltransferase family 4 protein [Euryarchaeota archaeon]
MKIGILGTISWRTPPQHYGPWETVVHHLTEGLVERGYDVTLFATGDSITNAKLESVCAHGFYEDESLDAGVCQWLHISNAFEKAREFDILHSHYDFYPLTFSRLTSTPLLTTIHGFSSERILPVYRKYSDSYYVSISNSDRAEGLNYVATVYNGIAVDSFDFSDAPDDYLLFFGRISYDKGTHRAIEVAKETGMTLKIAGLVASEHRAYFEKYVKPEIDGEQIQYLGMVNEEMRNELFKQAYCNLHLISFAEPFGLTLVESLACGTPVIATNKGSVSEILIDGETGFIVESVRDAIDKVARVPSIRRQNCRRRAEFFDVDRMVDGYIKVYETIMEREAKQSAF